MNAVYRFFFNGRAEKVGEKYSESKRKEFLRNQVDTLKFDWNLATGFNISVIEPQEKGFYRYLLFICCFY